MILRVILFLLFSVSAFSAEFSLEIVQENISPDGENELDFYKFISDDGDIPALYIDSADDILTLTIKNSDENTHKIYFEEYEVIFEFEPGEEKTFSLDLVTINKSSISFYCIAENEKYKLLGLYGSLEISNLPKENLAFWHLKEYDSDLFNEISKNDKIFYQEDYDPDFFLLNYKFAPDIYNNAPEAKVDAKVGEVFRIHIVNTGNSIHSLHFHGFHVRIIESSRSKNILLYSEKDTFPVYPGENVVVEMIPDKPGKYPVHDHNLVATTSNNIYPNGIFTIMDVAE